LAAKPPPVEDAAPQAHIELDEREKEEAEERALPAPHVVFESIRNEGEQELQRSTAELLWSGLAAGLSIGFSLIALGLLRAYLPPAPWEPLVQSVGYVVGFLVVVLGRQQLFTENTLTPVLPILVSFTAARLRALARLWGLVFVANMAGCATIALALVALPIMEPPVARAIRDIALANIGTDPLTEFVRAIFAGWLIALMVWLLPASQGGARPGIVVMITYLIAACGFPHVVAGSVEALYAVFRGDATFAAALTTFYIPTLLGNVAGGVLLVSLLSFGQVSGRIRGEKERNEKSAQRPHRSRAVERG
jgi:formate/nitrite transporter FocA (FNT family)